MRIELDMEELELHHRKAAVAGISLNVYATAIIESSVQKSHKEAMAPKSMDTKIIVKWRKNDLASEKVDSDNKEKW